MNVKDNEAQAKLLKTLAHPARLELLKLLLDGPKCACRANDVLQLSQPNLSQHLKSLREAGIVAQLKIANKRCYYIREKGFVLKLFALLENEHETATLDERELRERMDAMRQGDSTP